MVEAAHGMAIDDPGEHVGKISFRIDATHFVGSDQRGQDCPMFSTAVGAGEPMILRPSAMGRMVRSTALESVSTRPSLRKRVSLSQRVSAYRIASAIVDFPETAASWAANKGFNASTSNLLRSCRTR